MVNSVSHCREGKHGFDDMEVISDLTGSCFGGMQGQHTAWSV